MPGVTFTCPPVSGSGTITKTGAGVAAFPDVAAGVTVTVAEQGTIGSPLNDGVLYLTGGDVTVNVAAAGQTVEITSLVKRRRVWGLHGYHQNGERHARPAHRERDEI